MYLCRYLCINIFLVRIALWISIIPPPTTHSHWHLFGSQPFLSVTVLDA